MRSAVLITLAALLCGASAAVLPARGARAPLRSAMRMAATSGDAITKDAPLRVLIAGGGVGGMMVAKALRQMGGDRVEVQVLERVRDFKLFGGPIQLASNALQTIKEIDPELYKKIEAKATFTGDRQCGIKDGIRTEWYAKFDLLTPAKSRGMPPTCVVARPDLQEIFLNDLGDTVKTGAGVASYERDPVQGVSAIMNDGSKVRGDVLIGADGIWSSIRAKMYGEPLVRGPGATAEYSGYTVFAGECYCDPPDRKDTGYKVYIGPEQYFVISDIGGGQMQWYAFVALNEGFIPPTDMLSYIKKRCATYRPALPTALR
jgi:zeaxanthin epoxidase